MTTASAPPASAARLIDTRGPKARTRCRASVTGHGLSKQDKAYTPERPLLAFTGGGIYFFWQVGVVLALRERLPSLKACDMVRCSPALSASILFHPLFHRAAPAQAP